MNNIVETKINFFDKIVHAGAYLILTLSWLLSYKKGTKSLKNHFLLAFAVFVYGIVIEVLQETIAVDRSFEMYDILANFIGCISGSTTFTLFNKNLNR